MTQRQGLPWGKFFDVQSPIFKPMWRRVLIVGLCTLWALFEAKGGNTFWAILFGAAAGYLGWQFFVAFDPDGKGDE